MSPAQNLIKIQSKKKNNNNNNKNKSNKKSETNPNRRDRESLSARDNADTAAAAAPLCSELVSVSFNLLTFSSFYCWCVDDFILFGL